MKENPMLINTDSMLKYLTEFDYIEKKYGFKPKIEENLSKVYLYEQSQQKNSLQTIPANYMEKTIERIYSFSTDVRIKSTKIFHIIRQEFLNKFLNISGLELLFNEHYFDFEWDMHWGIDFEKTSPEYYRDHFEHQIRNMYMMLILMDDFDMISDMENMHLDESLSKVSEYVSKRFKEHCYNQTKESECYNIWSICAKEYYVDKLKNSDSNGTLDDISSALADCYAEYKNIDKNDFLKDMIGHIRNISKKNFNTVLNKPDADEIIIKLVEIIGLDKLYFERNLLRYILRSAAIMAALFHDVSYPLCHFRKIQNRISEYLPSMNQFIHNSGIDYDRIISTIQPSLLCMLVSSNELKKGLDVDKGGKYDHGIYSAITFLLSFYEGGRIHDLSLDKQIAVELAALAIYNHNFNYRLTESFKSQKELPYFRPIFTQNPISCLLKLCDELQEWDRRYFELSDKEEHFFCEDCMYPIIKYRTNTSEYEWKTKYVCGCNNHKNYKPLFFNRREMYIVTTCKSLDFEKKNNNLIARINYDPLYLLRMVEVDTGYAKFRSKALMKLKKLFLNQRYYLNESSRKIENIYVDYVMTANPLYLKAKILQRYIWGANKSLIFQKPILNSIGKVILKHFEYDLDAFVVESKKNIIYKNKAKHTNVFSYSVLIDNFIDVKLADLFHKLVKSPELNDFIGETIDYRFNDILKNEITNLMASYRTYNVKEATNTIIDDNEFINIIKSTYIRRFKISLFKYISASLKNIFLGYDKKEDWAAYFSSLFNLDDVFMEKNTNKSKLNLYQNSNMKINTERTFNDQLQCTLHLAFAKEALFIISQMLININYILNDTNSIIKLIVKAADSFVKEFAIQNKTEIIYDMVHKETLLEYIHSKISAKIETGFFDLTESLIKCCVRYENKSYLSNDSLAHKRNIRYLESISNNISFYNKLAYFITLSELELYKNTEDSFIDDLLNMSVGGVNDHFKSIMTIMLKDVFNIISNTISTEMRIDTTEREQKYLQKYLSNNHVYHAIESYSNPLNWYGDGADYREFSKKFIDFHSDLYLFDLLGGKD